MRFCFASTAIKAPKKLIHKFVSVPNQAFLAPLPSETIDECVIVQLCIHMLNGFLVAVDGYFL